MNEVLEEFFQRIYDLTKNHEAPEFVKHAHECDVRWAMQNPEEEGAAEILARDSELSIRVQTLRDTYHTVMETVEAFPEPMQPTVLHVLAPQVDSVLTQLKIAPELITQISLEMSGILGRFKTPTMEELQAVGQQLQEAEA